MTTFNSLGIGRTIGAGINELFSTDFQISVNSTNGVVTINLPPISFILNERVRSGYLQLIEFLLADISGTASVNKTTINASSGELINGLSTIDLSTNNFSATLTPTSDRTWSLVSDGGSGSSIINVQTIVSAPTVTPVGDVNDAINITAQAIALFVVNASGGTPQDFKVLKFRIKDNGTARAISWDTQYIAMGVDLPLSTVAGKILTIAFLYDSISAKWGCVAVAQQV